MSFDIKIVTESWLNSSVGDCELFPATYNIIRSDRKFDIVNKRDGGGVLVGLSDKIKFEVMDTPTVLLVPLIDVIICRCQFFHFKFFLVACYIPPSLDFHEYELFFDALEAILVDKPAILIGDFNLPGYNGSNAACSKVRLLSNFSGTLELNQFNSVFNDQNKLLDLV